MNRRNRAAACAVAAALTLAVGMDGSSHREAPGITNTPKLDGTDWYMFRSYEPGREGFVTLVANYYPFQDPFGGPNYFALDPSGVYEMHIDNDGNAVEDITFQFRPMISTKDIAIPVGGVNVAIPLINAGQIGPGRDDTANLNREESYSLNIIRGPRRGGMSEPITAVAGGATFKKPVDYIGTKSLPQYATYASNHTYDIVIPGCANGRVFVGQRKDPFVVNVGEIMDLVNTNPLGPENGESDDLARKNITSFILEVPIDCLRLSASQPIIGGWTTSSIGVGAPVSGGGSGAVGPCPAGQPASPKPEDRPGLTWVPSADCSGWVPSGHPEARGNASAGGNAGGNAGGSGSGGSGSAACPAGQPSSPRPGDSGAVTWVPTADCSGWVPSGHPEARGASNGAGGGVSPGAAGIQVSRLGAPLVNEVVIGLKDKDVFNSAVPTQDGALAVYVTNPTLPELLEILFPAVQAPNNFPRQDLVAAFLTGIPGLNQPAGVTASEMLRLNTSIAPTPMNAQSRLGALGGDNAGFPNGRRPGDDVVDIELRVAMGALCHAFPGTFGCGPADAPSGNLPFTDGAFVDSSFFDATFPYLRTPLRGAPSIP